MQPDLLISARELTSESGVNMNRTAKACALAVFMMAGSGTAQAVSWGTVQSNVGYGYGNYYNYGYVSVRNDDQHRKQDSGTDGIYVNSVTDFYNGSNYMGSSTSTSGRTTSHSYVPGTSNVPLRLNANVAQGKINVCEDKSFQPDPCSAAQAIPHFGY